MLVHVWEVHTKYSYTVISLREREAKFILDIPEARYL